MNWLDVVLVVLVVGYGLTGWWQGFIVGASATIGLLAGGAIGALVLPRVLDGYGPSLSVSLLAVAVVLGTALLGQTVGSWSGGMLRRHLTWRPAHSIDALGGAALSMAAVLVVAWALGYAVSGARIPALSQAVRASTVLSTVDDAMPAAAADMLAAFTSMVDTSIFPRYLEAFAPERIEPVRRPSSRIARSGGVRGAADGVVKVLGEAPQCGRRVEGSGFVYAPERVMTNAHVVAGVRSPTVTLADDEYGARVVLFDADLDVAVLAVDGLPGRVLRFARGERAAESGDSAAVLGYPENGPYDVRPARVRSEQHLASPDIYGQGRQVREVFAIRALVRSGNSGGPLVSSAGRVYGVVFAASLADDGTGYALSADQVAEDALTARTATASVATGGCT